MLKMRHCLLGLAVIGTSTSLVASPARAESKVSQCKRFDQTMNLFTQQIIPALTAVKTNSKDEYVASIDRFLAISDKGLKQVSARKFTDPKLQSMQNQAVNIFTDFHNIFVGVANGIERNDRATLEASLKKLNALTSKEPKLRQEFLKYCNKP